MRLRQELPQRGEPASLKFLSRAKCRLRYDRSALKPGKDRYNPQWSVSLKVRDHLGVRVVSIVSFQGAVNLPDIFQTWGFRYRLESLSGAPFSRAVIHDRNARLGRPQMLRRSGIGQPVMGHLVEGRLRRASSGRTAQKRVLHIPSQVAKIQKLESAAADDESDASGVFPLVLVHQLRAVLQ